LGQGLRERGRALIAQALCRQIQQGSRRIGQDDGARRHRQDERIGLRWRNGRVRLRLNPAMQAQVGPHLVGSVPAYGWAVKQAVLIAFDLQ
jgi:hypothetical protein